LAVQTSNSISTKVMLFWNHHNHNHQQQYQHQHHM